MTTREKLEQLLTGYPRPSSRRSTSAFAKRSTGPPQMAPLPAGWGETMTGEPMPNVAAAARRSRASH